MQKVFTVIYQSDHIDKINRIPANISKRANIKPNVPQDKDLLRSLLFKLRLDFIGILRYCLAFSGKEKSVAAIPVFNVSVGTGLTVEGAAARTLELESEAD